MPEELPPTLSRSEQSRINGAKSRGPITEEGKLRSSGNAMKHGLTSNLVMAKEEADDFAEVLRRWEETLKPGDSNEVAAVYRIAAAEFRANRAVIMQTNLLDYETDTRTKKLLAHWPTLDAAGLVAVAFRDATRESNALETLRRYEVGYERAISRNLKLVFDLQKKRLENANLRNEPEKPA